MKKPAKFIQIQTVTYPGGLFALHALDATGRVWEYKSEKGWHGWSLLTDRRHDDVREEEDDEE